jgi:hypothetical protein
MAFPRPPPVSGAQVAVLGVAPPPHPVGCRQVWCWISIALHMVHLVLGVLIELFWMITTTDYFVNAGDAGSAILAWVILGFLGDIGYSSFLCQMRANQNTEKHRTLRCLLGAAGLVFLGAVISFWVASSMIELSPKGILIIILEICILISSVIDCVIYCEPFKPNIQVPLIQEQGAYQYSSGYPEPYPAASPDSARSPFQPS